MCNDIRLAKIITKPWFENANFKFYHELILKAAKMKRTPTWKQQQEGNKGLRKYLSLGGEFWAWYIIAHKTYCAVNHHNDNQWTLEKGNNQNRLIVYITIHRILNPLINKYYAELTTPISALNKDLMRIYQWCCKFKLPFDQSGQN